MSKFSDDIDCKTASLQRFKFAASENGEVVGYASIFGNIDAHGERVIKGAYARSLARHRAAGSLPLMLWMHRPGEPIGSWKSMVEDEIGLRMVGQFNLNTTRGKDAYEHSRAGDVSGLSVGYREVTVKKNGSVLDLLELDLVETSVVSLPANPRARITGVKCETRADIERILREGGLPRAAAVKIANGGWPALSSKDEPDPAIGKLLSAMKAARLELKKEVR